MGRCRCNEIMYTKKPHNHRRTLLASLVAHRSFSNKNAHTHTHTSVYCTILYWTSSIARPLLRCWNFSARSHTNIVSYFTFARLVFTNCPCGKCHCWYVFYFLFFFQVINAIGFVEFECDVNSIKRCVLVYGTIISRCVDFSLIFTVSFTTISQYDSAICIHILP